MCNSINCCSCYNICTTIFKIWLNQSYKTSKDGDSKFCVFKEVFKPSQITPDFLLLTAATCLLQLNLKPTKTGLWSPDTLFCQSNRKFNIPFQLPIELTGILRKFYDITELMISCIYNII